MKKKIKIQLKNVFILLIISMLFASTLGIQEGVKNIFEIKFYYTVAIFMNLFPIAFFALNFKKAKKYPLFFIIVVFYYLIILPIWSSFIFGLGTFQKLDLNIEEMGTLNIIVGLNIFLLLVSQLFILKYVFIDIILGHRKARNIDIGIVFLTYITIGITFGFLYVALIRNDNYAISGMLIKNYNGMEVYLRSIYFSFITLTSVGYGEIIPKSLIAQGLVTLESVLGVLLLSFSLGIVLSSNLNSSKEKERNTSEDDRYKALKRKLMKEFEESLDKNLDEIIKKEKE